MKTNESAHQLGGNTLIGPPQHSTDYFAPITQSSVFESKNKKFFGGFESKLSGESSMMMQQSSQMGLRETGQFGEGYNGHQ